MSKLSRDRGNRFEYRLVYTGRKLGLDLEIHRQPSSGASDMHKLDVIIKGTNIDISLEAKYRKDGGGFKKLYSFSDYKDEIVILNNEYCIIEFNNYLLLKLNKKNSFTISYASLPSTKVIDEWMTKAVSQGGNALVVGMWKTKALVTLVIEGNKIGGIPYAIRKGRAVFNPT